MTITVDILKAIAPGSKKTNYKFLQPLAFWMDEWFPHFEIDSIGELRHILAQWAHETDSFNTLEEYASGKAYEGRADLGNRLIGDGAKFKGRGCIQVTGRANYHLLGEKLHKPEMFIDSPELLETPQWGVWSSCVYWQDHGLNAIANMTDDSRIWSKTLKKELSPIEYISWRINGGFNGLASRIIFYERAKAIIN